jgi:hypothetical protein
MTSMTPYDLKVTRGRTPPGGFFELFTPKSGWVNGGTNCGKSARTISVKSLENIQNWTLGVQVGV